ncbi:MAG: hypothetical protein ACK5U0_08235 [Gemmatimonas sp.]|jgi:hypothetical protein|uniref:hypothetical protein n=1 Tax=Gemmatimonas sp. TaxID=1962908 RepID=UPI0022C0D2AA|nr:hypothetical protein [Gemmatimonas sp.]MCA2984685.1 hypothetical protein [Gemmatimonas sp.]MCA2986220.1 hypothetical protein [Gemmatimonas sp.]MCA2994319.1 hypothetical protein [Gemmatimonas sp.]MCZ8013780.1 hypothetical protein [Gemmatimonas sp.]MCZ8267501.1 hypothetical protein [Gemmatimonas sp.]
MLLGSLSRPRVSRLLRALALALAFATFTAPIYAQQTVINAPSVDQTPKGRVFALHESQVRTWGDTSFWQTTHFVTYGVTKHVELAVTAYNIGTPLKRLATLGVGWKGAADIPGLARRAPQWEAKVGAGQMVAIPLRGERLGVWSYLQSSVRLPVLRTRLMAGVSDGPKAMFGKATTHFMGSFEQPLAALPGALGHALHDVTLLGEWWAGQHEFADFVPGFNYHRGKTVVILGYKLANAPGTRGDGIVFEIGRTF